MPPKQSQAEQTTVHEDEPPSHNVNAVVMMGLTDRQVEAAREQWGSNTIPTPVVPTYLVFVRQFTGFLPLLIAAAALISLAVQGMSDIPSPRLLFLMRSWLTVYACFIKYRHSRLCHYPFHFVPQCLFWVSRGNASQISLGRFECYLVQYHPSQTQWW